MHPIPAKRHAAAAERNREPILSALREILGEAARVLEVGSGTGQHAAFFTERMPGWTWQPTDPEPASLGSIEAYRREAAAANFLPPVKLDASGASFPGASYDAVFSANVIHIAPWSVALGILEGAASVLAGSGVLVLYGPFRFSGTFTAESNAAFDARLRGEDPSWGVRDVDDLTLEAMARGFERPRAMPMPVNNHLLVFRRRA